MSYVRWSSDDYQSDVYCFHSDRGFETHVANRRRVFTEPLPPSMPHWPPRTDAEWTEYWKRDDIVNAMVDAATMVAIGGPHDGAGFTDESEKTMGRRLAMLRDAGYHIPEGLIESLTEPEEG